MPVAIIVQTDAGDAADANSYVSVAYIRDYHALRGNSLGTLTDDQLASAAIQSTDYTDGKWRFPGKKLLATQTTQWPRERCPEQPLRDRDGNDIVGLPRALKNAIAEYALRAATGPLIKDTVQPDGGHVIKSTTDKVDVLEETVVYDNIPGYTVIPEYPIADNMLRAAGLIGPAGIVLRR